MLLARAGRCTALAARAAFTTFPAGSATGLRPTLLNSVRFASSNSSDNKAPKVWTVAEKDAKIAELPKKGETLVRNFDYYKELKDPPEPLDPAAYEMWVQKQIGKPTPKIPDDKHDPDVIFKHHMYTPPQKFDLSLGHSVDKLLPPLKWPEYDQSEPSDKQRPDLYYTYGHYEFDDASKSHIGDYPRLPMQWNALKDPYKYWDQQGRRNFGEVMQDHDHMTDEWTAAAPMMDPWPVFRNMCITWGAIGLVAFTVAWWDPSEHILLAYPDYPYDGLRVELGGDPNNPDDNWMRARRYEDQFDLNYKPELGG
ncbi:hypothetical protein HK101_005332 [Irineochytrium annulatum]|nr:hypothetical protein HK101_005332 [Irineochytrium annulatum]